MKKAILITLGLSLSLASVYGQERTPPTGAELIKKMDTDEDGKLSKTEVKGRLANDFETIDTDEDGYLSETELDNFKPKKRQKR